VGGLFTSAHPPLERQQTGGSNTPQQECAADRRAHEARKRREWAPERPPERDRGQREGESVLVWVPFLKPHPDPCPTPLKRFE